MPKEQLVGGEDLAEQYDLKRERAPLIDAMKGLAILLVVVGHSVQTYIPNYDDNLLFRFIYSFHMPLFMFLSGYITTRYSLDAIKTRFKRLVVPFVVWYLLAYIITHAYQRIEFTEYILRWIKSPDYGLWFLLVLFQCNILFAGGMLLKKYIGLWSFPVVYLFVYMIPTGYFGIGLLKFNFIPFIAGYLIANYRSELKESKTAALFSVALFALLIGYWHRVLEPSFIPGLKAMYPVRGYGLIEKSYRYVVAFAGIGMAFSFMQLFNRLNTVYIGLCWLGRYTLEIYCLHTYLLIWNIGTGYLQIFSAAAIALAASLLAATVLKQSAFLKRILFGQ